MEYYKISLPKDNMGTDENPDIAHIIVEAPDRDHAIFYAGAAFICERDEDAFASSFDEVTSTILVENSTREEQDAREEAGAAIVIMCENCGLPELHVPSLSSVISDLFSQLEITNLDIGEIPVEEPENDEPESTEPAV